MDTKPINNYPESELTHNIIGYAYEVYNALGPGYPEKVYQRALEKILIANKVSYQRELYCNLLFKDTKVGSFFLDFFVEGKVILELKARGEIYDKDIAQLLSYMKLKKIGLGLIILFGKSTVKVRRFVL